jgi:RNA polymerase sigma-70 factor, ECF subfamily
VHASRVSVMTPDPIRTDDFDAFYAAHFRRLTGQMYAYCNDMAEAQDLVQEAFCRALNKWERLSAYDDPVAWVRRVAWNLATSRWRRLRTAHRHAGTLREQHAPEPSPDRVALTRALATLPPTQRRAMVLHYLADMSTADIAHQDGIPEATVRSWLHRARTALAEQLSDLHH